MILRIPFLTFGSADIWFAEKKLVWRIYIAAKALPTTKQVEIYNAKKFVAAALGLNNKVFMVHVASILEETNIHLFC